MGIALIIIALLFLLWPYIVRWLQRYMTRRAEDMFRRMAGQPTRKEEQRAQRKQRNASSHNRHNDSRGERPQPPRNPVHPAKMMNEVAEDVEFTEIREYSESTLEVGTGPKRQQRIYRESQVEDARYTEIKTSRK